MQHSVTTRAVVLARGLGTRMRRHHDSTTLDPAQAAAADAGVKAMIPFGRPFLDHVLHSLAEAGVQRIALVLGPEHEQMRSYYRDVPKQRLSIEFATQLDPRGTADALLAVRPWTGSDPFLVLNADNLYPVDVLSRLTSGSSPAVPGFERDSLQMPLDRLGAFALIRRRGNGCLDTIVEKPGTETIVEAGPAALISMNVWRFDERICEACADVPMSARGEVELPQAVGLAASRGLCIEVIPVRGTVLDLSQRSDIAAVGRALEGASVLL